MSPRGGKRDGAGPTVPSAGMTRTDRRDTAASLLASGEAPADVAAVVGLTPRRVRAIATETTGRRGSAGRSRSAAVTSTTARGRAALAQLVADAAAVGLEVEEYLDRARTNAAPPRGES